MKYNEDNSSSETAAVYYQNVTIPAVGGDVEEEEPFSWFGQYTAKAGKVDSYDGNEYPAEFTMTVSDLNGYICVTEFLGNDVGPINYGGIAFTIAEDGMSAEMKAGSYVGGGYPEYLKLYDMNASTSPIVFTLNEDGSVSVSNFFIKHLKYNEDNSSSETAAVFYQNIVMTKNDGETAIENIVVENAVVEGIFDMQGRKIEAITAPGLYIINGKKVLVK